MQKRSEIPQFQSFNRPSDWFKNMDGSSVAELAATGSDIALVISASGTIEDLAYSDPDLQPYVDKSWIGRRFDSTVTRECVGKIHDLLDESDDGPATRRRQVNHPANGLADLPVEYAIVSIDGMSSKIALGNDLRKLANMQSQLMQAQLEMENEYRNLRKAETRYRILFQLLAEPMIILDGSNQRVLDINRTAVNLVDRSATKAISEKASLLFAKSSRESVSSTLATAVNQGEPQTIEVPLAANNQSVSLHVEPFRDDGQINLLLRIEPAGAPETGRTAIKGWDAEGLLWSFPEAIIVTNSDGLIEEVNDRFLDIAHALNREGVVGRKLDNWLGASPVDMQLLMSNLRDRGETRHFSTVVRDEFGGTRQVQVSAKRLGDDPKSSIGFMVAEVGSKDAASAVHSGAFPHDTSDIAELVGRVPLKELVRETSEIIERMCIEAALRQTGNNRASAADILGLSRQSLYIKLRRHGLEQFLSGD